MQWLKKYGINFILMVIGVIGVILMAYPIVSDWWSSFHQYRSVKSYKSQVAYLDSNRCNEIMKSAEIYNEALTEAGMLWTMDEAQEEAYDAELNIDDSGMIGYITISKIGVTLPIYHGTNEEMLQVAVGHLAGTSLPVGGESSHCVLYGHRGLPSARLFTDLDKMEEGDTFVLSVLERDFTYEVDQIRVVEPTDLRELQIKQEEDYCTLVTCTPYGINTHRLLVRGHRVENAQGEVNVAAGALRVRRINIIISIAALVIVVFFLLKMIDIRKRKKCTPASVPEEEQAGETVEETEHNDGGKEN